jgi:hypothetical protein
LNLSGSAKKLRFVPELRRKGNAKRLIIIYFRCLLELKTVKIGGLIDKKQASFYKTIFKFLLSKNISDLRHSG